MYFLGGTDCNRSDIFFLISLLDRQTQTLRTDCTVILPPLKDRLTASHCVLSLSLRTPPAHNLTKHVLEY